jgi:hypothetical protein
MEFKETRLRDWLFTAPKRLALGCAAAGLLMMAAPPVAAQARAAYIVQSDRGGMIGQRSQQIRSFRAAGQRVELRGTCLSACTMYLSLPNACVASNATFGFHGPTRNGQRLSQREFEHFSQVMADNYREPLRSWFLTKARHRTSGYYSLSGAELINMGYRGC